MWGCRLWRGDQVDVAICIGRQWDVSACEGEGVGLGYGGRRVGVESKSARTRFRRNLPTSQPNKAQLKPNPPFLTLLSHLDPHKPNKALPKTQLTPLSTSHPLTVSATEPQTQKSPLLFPTTIPVTVTPHIQLAHHPHPSIPHKTPPSPPKEPPNPSTHPTLQKLHLPG